MNVPDLGAGEELVLSEKACQLTWTSRRGHLFLTNKRIIFESAEPFRTPTGVDASLDTITRIKHRSWIRGLWGGFPASPPIAIETSTRNYTFQVLDWTGWIDQLERLTGIACDRLPEKWYAGR